jgi:hypothetical protein
MSSLLGLEEEKPAGAGSLYENVDVGPDPDWAVRAKRGANWFYWIAGLSVVNSVLFTAGANVHFLAGLGITEIVDALFDGVIAGGASPAFRAFAILFDLVFVIGFALCGYFANKFSRTVFIIGIVAYALDALIVLALGAFAMLAFHAFALYSLIVGFLACRKIKAYKPAKPALPDPAPAPTTDAAT